MDESHIKERIRIIPDGAPLHFKNSNLTIRKEENTLLAIRWISSNYSLITKERVLEELELLKNAYKVITTNFKDLEILLRNNGYDLEYQVMYDDYGKAGILLCSEANGNLKINLH